MWPRALAFGRYGPIRPSETHPAPLRARPGTCRYMATNVKYALSDFLQDRRRVSGTIRASRVEQHPFSHLGMAHFTWNPTTGTRTH